VAPGDEPDDEESRRGGARVEAVQEVEGRRASKQRERDLPGPPLAPGETAGGEQKRKRERPDESAGHRASAIRSKEREGGAVVGRQQGIDEPEPAGRGDPPREQERSPRSARAAAASE
jgi:hypothetical protein